MKISRIGIAAALTGLATGFVVGDAHAQSSVQLYGLVGTYVGSAKHSSGPASAVVLGSGGLTTSYWGMRGTEDIGGGNKVFFVLESFFQPGTGAQGRNATDPFFSRNAYIGFSNKKYGSLTLGRQTNPTYVNMQLLNPFGASVVFSPLVLQSFVATFNGSIVGDTVWNNAIEYTTPSLGGLKVQGIYGAGGIAGETGMANIGLHATYVNGPFTAAVSAQRFRTPVTAPVSQQYTYLGGATYDFRVAKLYAAAETTNSYGAGVGSHTYELGVSVPVTATGAILAEWARTSTSAPRNVNKFRNTGSIAYDYKLSKRTDVYVDYLYDKLSGYGSASTEALGIRHTF
jgi:predicted porin